MIRFTALATGLVCATLLASLSVVPTSAADGPEDVNGDGRISAIDLQIVSTGGDRGDVNGDGHVDALDLQMVALAMLARSNNGAPATPVDSGWIGAYYSNTSLYGEPSLLRADGADFGFYWLGAPAPGLPSDDFAVRWRREVTLSGDYTLTLRHDDGARIYVDGARIFDDWRPQAPVVDEISFSVAPGVHTLVIEYQHTWGEAFAEAMLRPASGPGPSLPTSTPTVTPTVRPATATTVPPTVTVGTPTPTPVSPAPPAATVTPTRTANPTPTPAGGGGGSATPTPTPTGTRTPTPSPTSTATPTATPTGAPVAASTATPTPVPAVLAGTRDKYAWPFAATSIWNRPIGSDAAYVPAGIQPANGWRGQITTDNEFIGLNPADPLVRVSWNGGGADVRVPPDTTADGSWNGVSAFLGADGNTVYQGQPLLGSASTGLSWAYNFSAVDLYGDGIAGAHGGSGLSSFGGSIRKGELSSPAPLRHALKVNLYAARFLSCTSGGFRWPAGNADRYMDCSRYGGSVPALRMGSLLALRPEFDCAAATSSVRAEKLCRALQDYGAYVADDTAWDVHAFDIEKGAEFSDGGSFDTDLQFIFTQLNVIDNNTSASPSGGGTPRAPMAPPFGN
ncbi:MAG: hypothetical protein HYX50_01925 [Chloroflexi bacterium]|nr:hypothetical protein [Chloroflexota bacterium]